MAQFAKTIKTAFTRHEAWAIKQAQRFPLFSTFAAGTVCFWFFVPALVIAPALIALMDYPVLFGVISGMGALVLLAIFMPWFFDWYLICVGLMFGRPKMAQAKEKEVLRRLKELNGD